MARFCTLFSGSSGNCTFLLHEQTAILIDAGVSCSRICDALRQIGFPPQQLSGVLVTHEHTDHIRGIGVLSRKYGVPVYANGPTMDAVLRLAGDLTPGGVHIIDEGQSFGVGGLEVFPFPIPHDAAAPMGYTMRAGGVFYSVATDIGHVSKPVLHHLCKSEAVVLEANHDVAMLQNGPYPYPLKKRILGDNGHLSNDNAAHLAAQLVIWGTKRVTLGHLSEHNNTQDKAYQAVAQKFCDANIKMGADVSLQIAPRAGICEV